MTLSRRRPPQQIGAPIQELLARLDGKGRFDIIRLMRVWPQEVGEAIARRTEVSSLKFHTAVIRVSGAMWIQELNLMKPQILDRLRLALGDDTVRELRFVQGRLSRREPSRLKPVGRKFRTAIELPGFRDPQLRTAFANLIEAWGRSPR